MIWLFWASIGLVIASFTASAWIVAACAWDLWRTRRPAQPTATAPCRWCALRGRAATGCTCTSVCSYERCIGDHTIHGGLTDADMRRLWQLLEEGK